MASHSPVFPWELPPRFSLLSLPLELQTKIVSMVHLQDQAYCKRRDLPLELESDVLDDLLPEAEQRWYGRGIAALFLSCRGLSQLAAVHHFSVSPLLARFRASSD